MEPVPSNVGGSIREWEVEVIEVLTGFPKKVLGFSCKGHVTKHDYETVLIPAVQQALQQKGKLRLYYQIGSDFSGIDPSAVWEDFKVGMEHIVRWERFAVVTDVGWIRHTIHVFSFLIPAAVKIFPVNEQPKAREWIVEGVVE